MTWILKWRVNSEGITMTFIHKPRFDRLVESPYRSVLRGASLWELNSQHTNRGGHTYVLGILFPKTWESFGVGWESYGFGCEGLAFPRSQEAHGHTVAMAMVVWASSCL